MLVLPIGDVNPREREPIVNYALIAVNVAAFLLFGLRPDYQQFVLEHGLIPRRPEAMDYLTSMFLHADIFHLGGNMLFLWICGDNVEDRLGSVGYLVFYLAAGLVADQAHIWSTDLHTRASLIPTIGASGAISGVLGAYLVLFPHSQIKIFYFFWIYGAGVSYVRSLWAIGFWFVEQLLYGAMAGGSNVAYWAHIGGFVEGAAVAVALIGLGAIEKPLPRRAPEPYRRRHDYDTWERW
ncbi:MAG: rhomboid family intramembrane serine protease [Planctomycetes bacterium]|nr:rhomboid family intramembrane serine protease [Planctomycetota bacterium]